MVRRRCLFLLAALFLGWCRQSLAEGGSQWRIYRTSDGLGDSAVVALSLSPHGHVWARHANGGITWLDGFQARSVPDSGGGSFPVYENRSLQLWSVYAEGVTEFRREQWVPFPVAEIAAENRSNALRLSIRPVPLLPTERDHLLALLPDRLLEFDAGQNRTAILRRAADTPLERFNDIIEARDGGAWLSGNRGLAKLPGPVRRLNQDSRWQVYPVDPAWQVRNLERPLEDDDGGVTVVAESLEGGAKRFLYFNGQNWTLPIPAPEKARFAWRDLDGGFWAASRSGLFRGRTGAWERATVPGLGNAQLFDVATEANGVFWLATAEGLARRAPQTWRTPAGLEAIHFPVTRILEDVEGGLWFSGADGLFSWRQGRLELHPWPDPPTGWAEAPPALFNAADGRILVSGGGQVRVFEPRAGEFSRLRTPAGNDVRAVLGELKPGTLCVQTASLESPAGFRLERLDPTGATSFFDPPAEWDLGSELGFAQVTEDETVWVGGAQGLLAWNIRTRTFEPSKAVPQGRAVGLVEAGKGRIWYATADAVSEFNGRTWSPVRFAGGRIQSMRRARDGSIWLATGGGAHRFADGSWVVNGVQDGLPANEVLDVFQTRRGEIWAATAKGVSLYHRSADPDPPVCSFVDGNPKEVYSTEVVTFGFHGRDKWDFTRPERLLFSRRLDDGPWSAYLPETLISVTNIAAGKHRLLIRAMDRNWNEEVEPEPLEFVSMVPWFHEPRLLTIVGCSALATLVLAGLVVNRHWRLVRSYAEVERIVALRTLELERANQELLHSQKMRALGTLAAGIAHDFNSILSIIRGSAQIIEANLEDREKIRTRVDRIKAMVEQGSGIVKAMLGFSRAGQAEKLCDVNQLLADTRRLLGDQFPEHIRLRFEPAPGLPMVRGVGELIQQMLLNLVLNAADAMSGQGEIVLRSGLLEGNPTGLALPPTGDPPLVFVSVSDQGTGIAPEILPRIFEPFFTTKAFSTRRGTGLGLSMVYEIAKELGYGLMVESMPGKGSTFRIIIPAAREEASGRGDG